MARQLKRWESPRKEGRNNKGRGGSARARQLKKQQQMLRKKLKEDSESDNKKNNKKSKGGEINSLPIFLIKYTKLLQQLFIANQLSLSLLWRTTEVAPTQTKTACAVYKTAQTKTVCAVYKNKVDN